MRGEFLAFLKPQKRLEVLGGSGVGMVVLTKWVDDLPVAIRADQLVRVHARTDGQGRLYADVYTAGRSKPLPVKQRLDQVVAAIAAAEAGGGGAT